jgi:hypothetical protein
LTDFLRLTDLRLLTDLRDFLERRRRPPEIAHAGAFEHFFDVFIPQT